MDSLLQNGMKEKHVFSPLSSNVDLKDKVKMKLSLCLTKYHNMKTYPVLN